MYPSRYLKLWPDAANGDKLLVFSTRRAAAGLLSRAAATALWRGQLSGNAAAGLSRLGFLVANPEEETAEVLDYLAAVNRCSRVVRAAVIPGMACNFACAYCYEGSLKGAAAMADATPDRLVGFLAERLTPDKTRLVLDFYGGEPLLYWGLIRRVAGAVQVVARERGVAFSFTLVSNGSLLTPEVVEELTPLGLSGAKVTLDGPAELHDRSRPYATGAGSFATILTDLRACCGLTRISLSGNYTRESWPRFVALLDQLQAVGLGPDALAGVRFEPVLQARGRFANREYCSGCSSIDEPWLVGAGVTLRGEILRRGYHTPKITPTPCMVDRDDAFTVNWDGTLTKCPATIGHDEYVLGNIWDGFTEDVETVFGGPRWKAEVRCRECEYLPLCFGGCRYMQLQQEGTMAGVECRKAFLDAILEAMIRQDVAYRWRRSEATE